MILTPRPYQEDLIAAAGEAIRNGARSVICASPTGSGKTLTIAEMARRHEAKGGTPLVLVHRHELHEQTVATLARQGSSARVDSLQRLLASGDRPQGSLVLPDECHHLVADKWATVGRDYLRTARALVGFTATPCRGDGVALGSSSGGLFDAMVIGPSIAWLTANGHLVPCEIIRPPSKQRSLAATPLDAYLEHAPGTLAIVFCRDVKHAKLTAEAFSAAGIPAACVEGRMSDAARADAFRRFRAGELRVLTNVMVCTEGLDVPEVETVILARGCSHLGAWLQIVGRALRTAPGKSKALIIDLTGAVFDMGLPTEEHVFSLEGRAIRRADLEPELAIMQCAACGMCALVEQFKAGVCARCGAKRRAKPDPRVRRAKLEQHRQGHTGDQRAAAFAQLVATGKARGYRPGWAAVQFKARYGYWPSRQAEAVPVAESAEAKSA